MKKLYLECTSGISGDMTVAALLDLGADRDVLERVLSGIHDDGFKTVISRVQKAGIDCCDFAVLLDEEHENHDHDMEYLYGEHHGHEDGHHHHHDHGHDHRHDGDHHDHDHHHDDDHHDHDHHHDDDHHDHGHDHDHDHHHSHRNLSDVEAIISSLDMTEGARALALKTFGILAGAESRAHGIPVSGVHFHEVGAIDSIVDIVAASVCFDNLGIDEVIIPRLCEGSGSVRCQHGVLPVPVPAVTNIVQEYALPISITERRGELITPTGAAFAAAVMTGTKLPDGIKIIKTGLGAGKREYEVPSILRAMLFEDGEGSDYIWKLECNIDDSTGEQLGYTMERLMAEGARDVFYTSIYMKKNRPAWLLSVITDDEHIQRLEDIIFRETTTIGIRRQKMERSVLPRRTVQVETRFGPALLKVCTLPEGERAYPEYESVRALMKKHDRPYGEVVRAAMAAYERSGGQADE